MNGTHWKNIDQLLKPGLRLVRRSHREAVRALLERNTDAIARASAAEFALKVEKERSSHLQQKLEALRATMVTPSNN